MRFRVWLGGRWYSSAQMTHYRGQEGSPFYHSLGRRTAKKATNLLVKKRVYGWGIGEPGKYGAPSLGRKVGRR